MASNQLALGKGLDLLIRETRGERDVEGGRTVPIRDISPNPNQPRRKFAEKPLEELAASIKSQGLLQPILVRPLGDARPGKYEIVAGERRWRASQLAGLHEVPVMIRNFSAQDTLTAALVENLQREDLNPLEEALGIQTLKEEFGLSQEDLALRLGKSRSAVANALRLLALPENIRADIVEGRLSAGHARALLSITAMQPQEYLRNLILEEHLSVREAEGMASNWKSFGKFHPESLFSSSVTPAESAGESGIEGLDSTADSGTTESSPHPRPAKTTPQSARMLDLQSRICTALSMTVRVTGKEDKGKISFTYKNKEELDALLLRFGLASQPALSGTNHAALGHTVHAAIQHAEHAMLGTFNGAGSALAVPTASALVPSGGSGAPAPVVTPASPSTGEFSPSINKDGITHG